MKSSEEVQQVGQKLVDPAEKLLRESVERKKDQRDREPKIATVDARNLSETSGWEAGTDGTRPERSKNFGNTLVNGHSKNTGDAIPAPTEFESGCDGNHDPRERSAGRKLRK